MPPESHGPQNKGQSPERTMPKCLMPNVPVCGDERGLAEFENAAAEVTPNAEINQALGKVRPAYVAPGKALLVLVAKKEGADDAGDDTAGAPVIEPVAVCPFRGYDRRTFRLIGHGDPRLEILGLS
jgi:hypothetical protein